MGRHSGGGHASLSSLARLAIAPARRMPHRIAVMGDSRAAALTSDGSRRLLSNHSPVNWANALLGQRMSIAAHLGMSGHRTDQTLALLPQAMSGDAGLLYVHCGVNDLAQAYPSAATSGANAAANLIAIATAARQAGMVVVIEVEVGAGNMTAAMIAQMNELNARLFAHAAATPGVHLHDARPVVMDPAAAEGALAYKTNHAYDAAHPNARGAQAWGRSLAGLLGTLVPPRPLPLPTSRADALANGRWQIARNALFLSASGGVLNTNASGTVPQYWEAKADAGSTIAVSSAAHADVLGNRVSAAITFGGVGQKASLTNDINYASNIQAGDVLQAYAEVTITEAAALAGLHLLLDHYTGAGGTSNSVGSLRAVTGTSNMASPVAGDKLTLATLPYTVPAAAGAGPFMLLKVQAEALGAGAAGFSVDRAALVEGAGLRCRHAGGLHHHCGDDPGPKRQ